MSYRIAALALSALVVGCSSGGTFEGQFTPQMGATLPKDMRVLAKAEPAASDLTCMVFEAAVNPDGTFKLDGLCKDTTYKVSLSEGGLLMEGLDILTGGQVAESVTEVKLWPAPMGEGVAMLNKDGTLKRLSTYTTVKTAKLLEPERQIVYPQHTPDGKIRLQPGQHLVLHGEKTIERMAFSPIIADNAERTFEAGSLDSHAYVGVRFTEEGVEEVTASMNTTKVVDFTAGDGHKVRYIADEAFDAGHYALFGEGDRKMYVISFGPEPQEAAAANK